MGKWEEVRSRVWAYIEEDKPKIYLIDLVRNYELFIFLNWMRRDEALLVLTKRISKGGDVRYDEIRFENLFTTKVKIASFSLKEVLRSIDIREISKIVGKHVEKLWEKISNPVSKLERIMPTKKGEKEKYYIEVPAFMFPQTSEADVVTLALAPPDSASEALRVEARKIHALGLYVGFEISEKHYELLEDRFPDGIAEVVDVEVKEKEDE